MTPGIILGALLSICGINGKCWEVQQISLYECKMEKDHLAKTNPQLQMVCAFRSQPPMEIDYD